MEYYNITVAGQQRSLPIVPISPELSIAAFVIFGDTAIVEPCARELAAGCPRMWIICSPPRPKASPSSMSWPK